ncbi:unnamed protein product [Rotaria sp. Silwood2]|nr:unnamed protein product [Rotaria sp. Silwood2]CAF2778775.1 unnamed protein product [Rotaria sp. Silwood2]CAF2815710.1 unnamed protein product [Rotaria sp. Silwood2]CAF3293240.1 unnamed protein product [Rotaria sp. Silwood2]CAF4328243.1 unnamed protein product [Rotaria sp. Silwood2]
MSSKAVHDSVDSIRLKECKQYVSVTFADSQSQPPFNQSSYTSDLYDLDIDALDAEFKRLTADYQDKMRHLRADPNNSSMKQAVLATKERMIKIKEWTSKLNTQEGRRLLNECQKDTEKRKYEIDQVLKVIKAQSTAAVCFIMNCTGSMEPYVVAAKNAIINLTKALTALFRTATRLAFISYRDVDHGEKTLSLNVQNLNGLIKSVSKAATNTIMTTINKTMSIFKTTEQRKIYSLSNIEPAWDAMNVYPILITEFILSKTIEELFRPLFVGTGQGKMQIVTDSFAKGSLRNAYYGKLASDGSHMVDVVYKELISADPIYNTLTVYKQHL